MADTETTVISEPPCSTFDRPLPRFRNPDADDLDRLGASLDDLELCCCEPVMNEPDRQSAPEARPEDEQFLVDDVPIVSGQF